MFTGTPEDGSDHRRIQDRLRRNEFCKTLNSGGSYCDYWKGEIERDFEREASRAAANQSVTNLLDAQDWRDYRIEQWTLNCQ